LEVETAHRVLVVERRRVPLGGVADDPRLVRRIVYEQHFRRREKLRFRFLFEGGNVELPPFDIGFHKDILTPEGVGCGADPPRVQTIEQLIPVGE
jgi:hypothetical protein